VQIERDIDVALAARLAEISLDDFKSLNPSANRPVLLAAGTPQILLPWDNAEIFQRNYEAFAGGQLATWTAWIAPTTLRVADAARRAGLSEDELRRINNIPPRVLIKAGSALLVPRSARMDDDVDPQVADNGQLEFAPEMVARRVTVTAGKKDTLDSLAQKHKVSVAQLLEWNELKPGTSLKAGQSVVLYVNPVKTATRKVAKTRTAKASKPVTNTQGKANASAPHAAPANTPTRVAKR